MSVHVDVVSAHLYMYRLYTYPYVFPNRCAYTWVHVCIHMGIYVHTCQYTCTYTGILIFCAIVLPTVLIHFLRREMAGKKVRQCNIVTHAIWQPIQ